MLFGISTFLTDVTETGEPAVRPAELAKAVEERGFESLLTAEHTHMPARPTPWPGGDAPIPAFFRYTYDPFVALSMAAAATRRLRVGTGVTVLTQRDPILLAKEAATLDVLSGGRLILGIGAGWHRIEVRNHGVDPKRRFGVMRERARVLRRIWTEELPEFHGEHVDFDAMYSFPKPVQRPHPPILLGGWSENVYGRVLDYADGWLSPPEWGVEEVTGPAGRLREQAAERGLPEPQINFFLNSLDSGDLEKAAEIRPRRILFSLSPMVRDDALRRLDELAEFMAGHNDF
ncbi:LLM class F420-dependent oxidoreductase [Saccharopolyspora erythraea]|uniref:LLM class F420-dependent oxidoreductase n=1 Tax=Saccharopolyspora erythraea TaxID=1836 RepID=UPI001BAC6D00|nr:LLM class F420-dependent oxidoreductase [Saccharopolyspora erythraea]QUH02158.1 LLM class F420-dependent oxidoreductase [Saccharopolyspora erythraea]